MGFHLQEGLLELVGRAVLCDGCTRIFPLPQRPDRSLHNRHFISQARRTQQFERREKRAHWGEKKRKKAGIFPISPRSFTFPPLRSLVLAYLTVEAKELKENCLGPYGFKISVLLFEANPLLVNELYIY